MSAPAYQQVTTTTYAVPPPGYPATAPPYAPEPVVPVQAQYQTYQRTETVALVQPHHWGEMYVLFRTSF